LRPVVLFSLTGRRSWGQSALRRLAQFVTNNRTVRESLQMTRSGRISFAFPSLLLLSFFFAAVPARGQTTVVFDDFETGTLQGWIPRGPVTLTNTEEVGSRTGGAGTHSLRTTGRTQGFHGPSLETQPLLAKGATYQVSVWARLVAGQAPAQLRVTMQRTVGGTQNFD